MDRHWNLREELYNLFHRWPILLAAVLIGSLLGWGLAWIWPSFYRATGQVYVALNPYRKFSDTLFEALANPKYSNLDNYHYWQMSQLESAIYLDSFLQPVLDRLREQDSYWSSVELDELRGWLDSEWRSSGTWSLIVNHPEATFARQAVEVWGEVVIEQVTESVAAARRMFMIDQQLQAGETEGLRATLRRQDLVNAMQGLNSWLASTSEIDPDAPLEGDQRWRLLALVTPLAEFTPAWMGVLEDQPPAEAALRDFQAWSDQVRRVMQAEKDALEQRLSTLDQQQIELAGQYSIESVASRGFSPNIEIEGKEYLGERRVRPSSTFVLIGGIIGFLIGLLIQLIMISNPWKRK